jgi:hypothetical protein
MERRGFQRLYRQARWLVAALLAIATAVECKSICEKDGSFSEIVLESVQD